MQTSMEAELIYWVLKKTPTAQYAAVLLRLLREHRMSIMLEVAALIEERGT